MKAVIDFAVWYSGMERSKVEKAYNRYLDEKEYWKGKEDKEEKKSLCKNCADPVVEGNDYCYPCAMGEAYY